MDTPNHASKSAHAQEVRHRQASFFARTGFNEPLRDLFDYLPHHRFFIKSASGHFLDANQFNLQRLGLATKEQIIGLTDQEAHPPDIARACRRDDLRIMKTLKPMVNQVEMLFHDDRSRWEWGCTTKLPLLAGDGRVLGVVGISYPVAGPKEEADESINALDQVVALIRQHHGQPLRISDLASRVGLNSRRLNQLFQQHFRMRTQQFIIHTRVQASVQTLLRTRMALWEVALEHGFTDQSAFTRDFRRIIGRTPQEFRTLRSAPLPSGKTADFA